MPKRNQGRRLEDALKQIALVLAAIYCLMDWGVKILDKALEAEIATVKLHALHNDSQHK
jgi:hypothetical protein